MKIFSQDKECFCKVCFCKISRNNFYSFMTKNLYLCDDCKDKISAKFTYFDVEGYRAMAIFNYDSELKQLIYQFKGCFDIELKDVFLERYSREIALIYKGFVVIPAPSYEEENKAREFNHVIEVFSRLNLPMNCCVKKVSPFKQAEHKSKDRSEISKHLEIFNGESLTNKKVLLVDDVYTTGSTIRAMINLIKPFKPKKIKILVISKTVLKPVDT